MKKQIEILRNTRKHLLDFIRDLSADELNEIPKGFNNNIIWNVGHLIAAQQNVCYVRSGLKLFIDERYFTAYKPDTKPGEYIDDNEIKKIKELFLSVIDQLELDLNNNVFTNYTAWTNRYGVEITNIGEVLGFLPFHEGLHLGYIMALKRIIKNK